MRTRTRERGAVLVVSLIILLLMTLIGFASMNTSVMEVLMSANSVRQTETLSDAENTLRAGEIDTGNLVMSGTTAGKTYYVNHYETGTDPLNTAVRDWAGIPSATADEGEYVIEYVGPRDIPGCTAAWNEYSTGCKVHAHLVTARSGGDEGRQALRIVQSVFVTLQSP